MCITSQTLVFGHQGLTLDLAHEAQAPLTLTGLAFADTRLHLDHGVPLVELQTVDAGHRAPAQRGVYTERGSRLRYSDHAVTATGAVHTLRAQLAGSDQLTAELELRTITGNAAFSAQVTIQNQGTGDAVLTSAASLSMPITGTVDGRRFGAEDLELWVGANDWLGENRWSSRPLRDHLVDLSSDALPVEGKGAFVASSVGTWSTAADLPTGVVTGARYALAWQIEHNGAWRWEIGEERGTVALTLFGPADRDHQWVEVLSPGQSFRTVSVTVAAGRDLEDAIGSLTRYRRAVRRPHPDNEQLKLIYNDYMNTLMGDPTTERLLPLIDAAAAAGAEVFCIDAGWYDDGLNWWSSVGAWEPSTSRFPGGMSEVTDRIRSRGLTPGLWLEPEVVGVDSATADNLPVEAFFSRHGVRVKEAGRFHLDLRHPAARHHLDTTIDRLVTQFGIGYFKLDYNINPGPGTDHLAPSAGAGLLGHNRAHLDWLDGVLDRHPKLIIENCGSGAMRCDFAMLSRLQLQSTSDQQDVSRYVPIALAAPMLMLPEQAGSWAYPSPTMEEEETAASLTLGLLGRLYLSGYLNQLAPTQLSLVIEAVQAHKDIRAWIPTAIPGWPLGLPDWNAAWSALALRDADLTALTIVKRTIGPDSLTIPLPYLIGRDVQVETLFPAALPGWTFKWDSAAGLLAVSAEPPGLTARTFRLRHPENTPDALDDTRTPQ
jgi:alpha-galactosidase